MNAAINNYKDTQERRALDLRPDGIACVPLLGQSRFASVKDDTEMHVHPGAVEICLCVRGRLFFESDGQQYPFFPGRIFVSGPKEPHCLRQRPKGLSVRSVLVQLPRGKERILDLPADESKCLAHALTHLPVRLFPSTTRVTAAFERLFNLYDAEPKGTALRRLKMRAAVLELLLAVVDAPLAPSSHAGVVGSRIGRIVERMRADPARSYSVEALAREVAISVVSFNVAFKRHTGLPPHAFLLELRVNAARKDLAAGGSTIAEVAAKYSFHSTQHFSSTFKRIMGKTPASVMPRRK